MITDEEIHAAIERGKQEANTVAAVDARYIADSQHFAVSFSNGIEVRFPLSHFIADEEVLATATPEQLAKVRIMGGGTSFAFQEPKALVLIGELMHGFPRSCREMSRIGKLGGSKTSEAKAAAARSNGKKGGQPKSAVKKAKAA